MKINRTFIQKNSKLQVVNNKQVNKGINNEVYQ